MTGKNQNYLIYAVLNTRFYFVIDESGATVAGQWESHVASVVAELEDVKRQNPDARTAVDSPAGEANLRLGLLMTAVLNIAGELTCLYPPADKLVILVVDEAGTVKTIGLLPGAGILTQDLSQFRFADLD